MSRVLAFLVGLALGVVFAPDKSQPETGIYVPTSCLDSAMILPNRVIPWLTPYWGEPPETGERWL